VEDGEPLLEAQEIYNRSVKLIPCGSATWSPALLAGGLIGDVKAEEIRKAQASDKMPGHV